MNSNNSRNKNDARQMLKISFQNTDYQSPPKHMQKQPVKASSRNIWAKKTSTIRINNPQNNIEHLRIETKRKAIKQPLLYLILKNEMIPPVRINIFYSKTKIKPTGQSKG